MRDETNIVQVENIVITSTAGVRYLDFLAPGIAGTERTVCRDLPRNLRVLRAYGSQFGLADHLAVLAASTATVVTVASRTYSRMTQ